MVVEGRRKRGRPKLWWEDGVMEDARKLGERNWRNAARNRDSWQKLLKKALAQKGAVVPMMMTRWSIGYSETSVDAVHCRRGAKTSSKG